MRCVASLSLLLVLLALPFGAAAPGDVLFETHVDHGAPLAGTAYGALASASPRGLGHDPVPRDSEWTHFVDIAGHDGAWVTTVVADHSGLGVWTRMNFHTGNAILDAECVDPQDEQGYLDGDLGVVYVSDICQVPAGTDTLYLRIEQGIDVDVRIMEVAAPGHDPDDPVVGHGKIAAAPAAFGTFWTGMFGYSGHYGLLPGYPDALPSRDTLFAFQLPVEGREGQRLSLEADDHGGAGYMLRMVFYEGAYRLDDDCTYAAEGGFDGTPGSLVRGSETCTVPVGAERVAVIADHGYDLDVTVLAS